MTAPRWEDVPEAARGAARQAMSLIRDTAPPGDKVRAAIDAALARLAEPAQGAVVAAARQWLDACAHADSVLADVRGRNGLPAQSRAAERWRAVPDGAKADARTIVEGEIAGCQGDGVCPECDALRALLALAREAEGER